MTLTREILQRTSGDNQRVLLALYAALGVPRSHLDVGSGDGTWVQTARALGVDAVGLDIMAEPPDIRHDLTTPIDLGRKFDLVTCIETAEHLPPSAADTLCQTIARHCAPNGVLVFTAALPGQGGVDHLNEQPPTYWRDKLWRARRFTLNRPMTAEVALLWSYTCGALFWLPPNVQVF